MSDAVVDNPPQMPWVERISQNDFHRQLLIRRIIQAGGISDIATASMLLNLSESQTRRIIVRLEKDGFLIREQHFIRGRSVHVFGISLGGLMFVDRTDEKPFELKRLNSDFVRHRLECARVYALVLKSEPRNGDFWKNEGVLRKTSGLKKIPDAIWGWHGQKIAIEVELSPKSRKRYEDILRQYLVVMEGDQKLDLVLWLVPEEIRNGLMNLLSSIPTPRPPNRDGLSEKRPYRFAVGALENFLSEARFFNGELVFAPRITIQVGLD